MLKSNPFIAHVVDEEELIPYQTSLQFDTTDPFAVTILFHIEDEENGVQEWSVCRESLTNALRGVIPTEPSECLIIPDPQNNKLRIVLSSDEGVATLDFPATHVEQFMQQVDDQTSVDDASRIFDEAVDDFIQSLRE